MKKPPSLKSKKLKGARARGKTYERKVGKQLAKRAEKLSVDLKSQEWLEFTDANGYGYCQPDFYFVCDGFVILVECKLTQTQTAFDQMTKLYMPVLKHIYAMPIIPVQVFKNIKRHTPNLIKDITDLYDEPKHGLWNWHYLGHY